MTHASGGTCHGVCQCMAAYPETVWGQCQHSPTRTSGQQHDVVVVRTLHNIQCSAATVSSSVVTGVFGQCQLG